jgi:hypothetical protein
MADFDAPPISSPASDQHAQNTWILGKLQGTVESMGLSLTQRLDEIVRQNEIRNGRLEKAEDRIGKIENKMSENKGERDAFRLSWSTATVAMTLIVGVVGLIIHYVK